MEFDLKKLVPWNWFKKEQEEQRGAASLPVHYQERPASVGQLSPIVQLQRDIDRLFDDVFRGFGFPAMTMPGSLSDWTPLLKPALDIQETEKQYVITMEVPGVDEKEIEITLNDDVLTVRGEKRREHETKAGGYHRIERSYGSFQRALNLPENANQDSIEASFRNGVLTIKIDKRETGAAKQGRSIPIKS
jgi:HSP20 family protein